MKERIKKELIIGLLSIGTITPFWLVWTKFIELRNSYEQRKAKKSNLPPY